MEVKRAVKQMRSDSSNKPCRTVEKVDWAMRRCRCCGLPLKKVKSAEKQKRSDTRNKPCKVKRAENQRDQIQTTNLAGP